MFDLWIWEVILFVEFIRVYLKQREKEKRRGVFRKMNEDDVSSVYYKEIDKAREEGRKQGAVEELERFLLEFDNCEIEEEWKVINKMEERLKGLKEGVEK